MGYLIVGAAALLASGLTLFSGFGLGTLLLPVFVLFFPVDIAIGMTATVHLLNNLFKLILLVRHADCRALVRFGIPAVFAAIPGAFTLVWFSDLPPLLSYTIQDQTYHIEPAKMIIGLLVLFFAALELSPTRSNMSFSPRYLPLGGLLSGFFGGLSGHQGAFRSAFLVRSGLTKESFIATGVVIACVVDVSRLAVYSTRFAETVYNDNLPLLMTAVGAAFTGAFAGSRLLQKITMRTVRLLVSALLFMIGLGLITGLV